MRVRVTYWYHSCFSIEMEDKVMLFDYPTRGTDSSIDEKIRSKVDGAKLYVFVSHAHGDHFSPEVAKFSRNAERTHFLISSGVPEDRMAKETSERSDSVTFTRMDPDKDYRIGDLKVKTWKSNDAGIAFLIDHDGKKIYYAGDLAKWDWPEWDEQKVKEHVEVFDNVVKELKGQGIDIAFSNMDQRLSSWSGPVEFIERVEPTYFIPMHTFGNESWVDDLVESEIDAQSEIFHYKNSGDDFVCDI